MEDELLINYRKLFKLKGYCDICYMELDPVKIGKFIYKLRIKNGDSQYTLADKVKLSRQAVSKWERGITIPNQKTLLKLSEIYHISINAILKAGTGKKNQEASSITMEEYARQVNNNMELQERIVEAIEYIEKKGRLKYKPKELIKILEGENEK